jgi:hypothetical protein
MWVESWAALIGYDGFTTSGRVVYNLGYFNSV